MKLTDQELYEVNGKSYSLAELEELVDMAESTCKYQPNKEDIEDFFRHGEKILPSYDVIFCTEDGSIIFANQNTMRTCPMRYGGIPGNGFSIMQYCTDNLNRWTRKVVWMTEDYWKTIESSFTPV